MHKSSVQGWMLVCPHCTSASSTIKASTCQCASACQSEKATNTFKPHYASIYFLRSQVNWNEIKIKYSGIKKISCIWCYVAVIEQLGEEQSFLAAVTGTEQTIKIPAAEGEKFSVWGKNNNQSQRTLEEAYCFLVPNKLMFLEVNCSQYDWAIGIVLDTTVPIFPCVNT